jgi:hypothetical protein
MDERILKWLFDIKMSIDEINEFFHNEEKDLVMYQMCWWLIIASNIYRKSDIYINIA